VFWVGGVRIYFHGVGNNSLTHPQLARQKTTHDTKKNTSWRRAFALFGAGIPSMFANLAVASWIKFDGSAVAAALVTGIMAASMLAAALFHRKCEFFCV
jgi:hypothetical protein